MRPLPANQLDPKIKNVWRISDALWITLAFLAVVATFAFVVWAVEPADTAWAWAVVGVLAAVWVVMLVVWVVALPPIRFIRWRYEVCENELYIARGIVWRQRFVIPFVRVQDTDTRQGPILRAFGLARVTVSTAAGDHDIPGLAAEEADALRDRIAEQARLAQEDV